MHEVVDESLHRICHSTECTAALLSFKNLHLIMPTGLLTLKGYFLALIFFLKCFLVIFLYFYPIYCIKILLSIDTFLQAGR